MSLFISLPQNVLCLCDGFIATSVISALLAR